MNLDKFIQNFSARSAVALLLVTGSLGLAVIDREQRPLFTRLADVGLGGYLGQLVPKTKE